MAICAVCQLSDGLVVNIIMAEPTDPCPEPDCQLVLIPQTPDIGWYFTGKSDSNTFTQGS